MDIDAIRSFLAFVDTGSFTRAAAQVHRTQSAVSMQMKKLEQDIGHALFAKQGRNLVLSTQGQNFSRYARQLIQLHDDTLRQMTFKAPTLLLRLGCPDDYADSILPAVTHQLHTIFPTLDLQITCAPSNKIKQMIDSDLLDVGIITRSSHNEEGYFLAASNGVWICENKELLACDPLPIAIFQKDCRFHQAAIEGLLKNGIHYKIVASCASASALKSLVNSGLAIGAIARISHSKNNEIVHQNLPELPNIEVVLIKSGAANCPLTSEFALSLSTHVRNQLRHIESSD